jgi:hypothetical protein
MKEIKDMVTRTMKRAKMMIKKNKKIKRKRNHQNKKKNLNLKEKVIKVLQLKSHNVRINDVCYLDLENKIIKFDNSLLRYNQSSYVFYFSRFFFLVAIYFLT